MKKRILLIAGCILLSAAFVFSSCGKKKEDIYDKLNAMLAEPASAVELEITVTKDGETLKGEYAAEAEGEGYRVEYSYEKLATFEKVDGEYVIPDEYKETLTGSMFVEGGKIVEQNGSPADIDPALTAAAGVEFDAAYFSSVKEGEGTFEGVVTDPEGFMNADIDCTAMTVTLAYSDGKVDAMTIGYTSQGGAAVVIAYTFA